MNAHLFLLNQIEQDFHQQDGMNDTYSLDVCYRTNIGPHQIVEQTVAFREQFEEKSYCCIKKGNPNLKKFLLIWSAFWAKFIMPFYCVSLDQVFDVMILHEYYKGFDAFGEYAAESDNVACYHKMYTAKKGCNRNLELANSLAEIPRALPNEVCFAYALAFLLIPIIPYCVEWYYVEIIEFGMLKEKVHVKTSILPTVLLYFSLFPLISLILVPQSNE